MMISIKDRNTVEKYNKINIIIIIWSRISNDPSQLNSTVLLWVARESVIKFINLSKHSLMFLRHLENIFVITEIKKC